MQSSTIRACIPNISTRETRKRLLSGMIMLVFGLSVLVALLAIGINPLWRLALFPVFFGAAVGVFQWRGKTWVWLAARGSRQLSQEVEKIEDPEELKQVRKQARTVKEKAFVAGLLVTLIAYFLPW